MFIVIELQKNEEQVTNLVTTHATAYEAESKYHQILSAAAISEVGTHSAIMLTDAGEYLKSEHYTHSSEDEEPSGS